MKMYLFRAESASVIVFVRRQPTLVEEALCRAVGVACTAAGRVRVVWPQVREGVCLAN